MAAEKKPFALRIQPELLKAIERWAADEFRSVNGQIEFLLHKALKESGRLKEEDPSSTETSEKKRDEKDGD